jgi:hypothetical protein
MLREAIDDLRAQLEDKNAPFGVDLAIPQVGGSARKTNVRPPNLLCVDGLVFLFFHPISTIILKANCLSSPMS